jgi:hypothetical protein
MKIKNLLTLSAVVFFTAFNLFSQKNKVNVTLGPELKKPSKTYIETMLGNIEDNFYVIRSKNASLFSKKIELSLEVYNSKMDLKKTYPITFKEEKLKLHSFELLKGTIYCFYTKYEESGHNVFYVSEISTTGKIGKPKKVVSVKVEGKKDLNSFKLRISPDTTKIMIASIPDYQKKADQFVDMYSTDLDFEEVEKITIEFSYKSKDFNFHSFKVDNVGNMHILAQVRKAQKAKKESAYEYKIFTYFAETEEFYDYNVDLDKNYMSEVVLRIDKDNNIVCSGFYSDNNSFSTKGIFYLKLNTQTKEIEVQKTNDFDKKFLSFFMSEKKANKGKPLYNMVIRDLLIKEDGGLYFIAENYYIREVTRTDQNGRTTTTYYYHYNDVIVADISKEGKVNWWTVVPKYQVSANDGGPYSSIAWGVSENNLHIVFNENKKNAEILQPNKVKSVRFKKSVTVLVTFDSKGKAKKTALFPAKDGKTLTMPKVHVNSSSNELIMLAQVGKNYRFVKLNL